MIIAVIIPCPLVQSFDITLVTFAPSPFKAYELVTIRKTANAITPADKASYPSFLT